MLRARTVVPFLLLVLCFSYSLRQVAQSQLAVPKELRAQRDTWTPLMDVMKDKRPRVTDEQLERLRNVSIEVVWGAIHHSAQLDYHHIAWLGVFAASNVVGRIPIPFLGQLPHTFVQIGALRQIAHGQSAPDHLHTGLRLFQVIDETSLVAFALNPAPNIFNRKLAQPFKLFIGDARTLVFLIHHIHQRRPSVALFTQVWWNLRLRLTAKMDRRDGGKKEDSTQAEQN